jgi:CDP-glycerol glycerophosphotransferase
MEGEKDLTSYKKNFIKNTRTWDYLITQNSYSTHIFMRAFGFHNNILEIGYPRNDLLFHKNNLSDIAAIKKKLGLPEGKKLILYAPTWRDNEHYGHLKYRLSTQLDLDYLKEKLSSEYAIMIKSHYLVGEKPDFSAYEGFVYPFGPDYDIAELYLAADILVTDYSSVMFDYSILKRPMVFFTYDINQYRDSLRGFYFDFMEEAPGPITTDTKELADIILSGDYKEYEDKYTAFVRKYNHADQGNASAKVVDLIISHR